MALFGDNSDEAIDRAVTALGLDKPLQVAPVEDDPIPADEQLPEPVEPAGERVMTPEPHQAGIHLRIV